MGEERRRSPPFRTAANSRALARSPDPADGQRAHPWGRLRAHRAGLHDGLRDHRPDQLRARRRVHARPVHPPRLLRAPRPDHHAAGLAPGHRPAPGLRRHHAHHRGDQRHHRSRGLPPPPQRPPPRAPDHRHPGVVYAGEPHPDLRPVAYPCLFPSVDTLRDWFGIDSLLFITTKDVLVLGATIPLMVGLQYFVTRTRWGKAMRATAQDKETALAMGIDVERTIILTFFSGGALAGAAGLIQGLYYNIGMWWMGYQAGLRAFTAAVLGGIGSMPGAALGGLLIGFLSARSDLALSARGTSALVFAILILVLVFRPQGLLGERVPDKA